MTALSGVIAAAATPLRPDLEIDRDRLVRHCGWLLENGCDCADGPTPDLLLDDTVRATYLGTASGRDQAGEEARS